MSIAEFEATLADPAPPAGLAPPLEALWRAANGEWSSAHALVKDEDDGDAAWVHAYLHRSEGDTSNAAYWYRRAGRSVASGPLEEEWRLIAEHLLGKPRG